MSNELNSPPVPGGTDPMPLEDLNPLLGQADVIGTAAHCLHQLAKVRASNLDSEEADCLTYFEQVLAATLAFQNVFDPPEGCTAIVVLPDRDGDEAGETPPHAGAFSAALSGVGPEAPQGADSLSPGDQLQAQEYALRRASSLLQTLAKGIDGCDLDVVRLALHEITIARDCNERLQPAEA